MNTLKHKIMRRIWYSYSLSVIFSRSLVRGLVLGMSVVLFFQLVSVSSVIQNILGVKVSAVPEYIWQTLQQAVIHGEFMKLLTLGVIVFSLLTFRISLRPRPIEFGKQAQHI